MEKQIFTRKDVIKLGFTEKEVAKIFHYLDKRKKLIKVGKEQKVFKDNLVELLKNGITI